MNDNNNISVNVQVNADGQEQLKQYSAAFDSLRTSINNLSSPVSKLDGDIRNLNDTLSKLNSQNQLLATSSNKVKDTVDGLSSTFSSWKTIIDIVKTGVISLEDALTGGLAVLTLFGPAILNWVENMLKGTTTLSALNKVLQDNKTIMNAINQTRQQGEMNAQQELVNLKLLYEASQDHNLALNERKKIVGTLQSQYPNQFGNLSSESILIGKATDAYKQLTATITATSKARSAEDTIANNQQKQLSNSNSIKTLTADLNNYNKQLAIAQKNYDDLIHHPAIGSGTVESGSSSLEKQAYDDMPKIEKNRDALKRSIKIFKIILNYWDE